MQTDRSPSPQSLGAERFRRRYGLSYAYMAGSMAQGVASERLVEAMTKAGLLASFGAAGLSVERVRAAVRRLKTTVAPERLCVNLIHAPLAGALEMRTVEVLLQEGVTAIEASAYIEPTLALVLYRARGAHMRHDGPQAAHRVIAKISRREVARHFMQPPPEAMLKRLCEEGALSRDEAQAASQLALADDVTVEADSGGHTDNQQLLCAFPAIRHLCDEIAKTFSPAAQICIGAAGGLGTPEAIAAAFALGADYVVTGSINQATIEAGTSERVKTLLAEAMPGDFAMAPAADLFELGGRVQVLRRGTLFAQRAQWLYDLYLRRSGLDALSTDERRRLETELLQQSIDDVWQQTCAYWQQADPQQLALAGEEPKLKMAMLFRWYLGNSSRWASEGDPQRVLDYQIWCGPAMAAFNLWSRTAGLAKAESRSAPNIAQALLEGAARHLNASHATQPQQPQLQRSVEPAPQAQSPATVRSTAFLREWLLAQISQQIGIAAIDIDPSQPFQEYGIDSAAAVLILGRLERLLGQRLSPALIWNYPNIDALAERLSAPARSSAAALQSDQRVQHLY